MEQIQNNPIPSIVKEQKFSKKLILLFIVIGIIASVSLVIALMSSIKSKPKGIMISGIINYTALKPDPGDRGEIQIKYRKYNTKDQYKLVTLPVLAEKAPWACNNLISAQPYELIADLWVDGQLVTSSEPLIVTAPASNQSLNLRVTWHDLPASVVSEQTTFIKGQIFVNGLIPSGATILVQAKLSTDKSFQTVVTNTNVGAINDWKWDKTTPLKDYLVKAVLMQGNTEIANSETVVAAGGDSKIDFILNSSAITGSSSNKTVTVTQAPTIGGIKGKVFINGPENENTSLLMLWKNPGEKDFKVISRINNPSHNGQSWNWNNVTVGKQYEITAVLQVNETNTASTQYQIVTAPAENINFTLNTGVFVPTPSGTATVNACNSIGNNQYNAVISYPRQSNAGNYWIQVGRGSAGSDVYNSKIQANSGNPQITVQIDGGRSYYTQYAYSLCKNCSEDANFSNFSSSVPFSCGGGQVYTGYVCNSSNNTCQLTTDNNPPYSYNNAGLQQCQQDCRPKPTATPTSAPTSTPVPTATPTPTPKIAYCDQSCGGNGYTCDDGLDCVSGGGGIGSNVCRNPQCPEITNCNCP